MGNLHEIIRTISAVSGGVKVRCIDKKKLWGL
jgi:hypothetical protein